MRWFTISLGALGLLVAGLHAPPVLGHARLLSPTPISSSPGLKQPAPCGAPAANTLTGAPPTELVIGDQILIQWEETIDHDGYYRLSIDPTGTESVSEFAANVLADQLPDINTAAQPLPHPYETTITVPNLPCDPCLLQMVRFMSATGTFYHSCAEIRIVSVAGATPTPTPGGNPANDEDLEGGCSCSTTRSQAPSVLVMLLVAGACAIFARRRNTGPPNPAA